ncbi:MAG: thiamine pyrophosphate-dependent enzyme, partial [Chitinophagaceae bacterium]
MHFERKDISDDRLIQFYAAILLPRMIEEKMLVYLRQGKISKWFSGIGQEAIAVGTTLALDDEDWIMPMHRNLGVFTTRNMPLSKLFLQWQGSKIGYSNGRERSFHFGSKEHHICGMISHLGPQLAIADGVALAHQIRKTDKIALAFTGEGGTSEGDFHEALNVAAVWDLPVIFLIENNGYGLSTPTQEQYRCQHLVDRAKGYGMESIQIDGNNLLTVYDTIRGVRDYCIRYSKPYLIECMTFRMRGHEEASGIKYVPKELIDEWSLRDPVKNYEAFLLESGLITPEQSEHIRMQIKEYIETELQTAQDDPVIIPNREEELQAVYAEKKDDPQVDILDHDDMVMGIEQKELRFLDAISEGLSQSMEKHEELILMGQDIAAYGGAFKVTEGFLEKFGAERVRNTPICESAIVGAALGLSI